MARADQIAAFTSYLDRVADGAEAKIKAAIHQGAAEMVMLAQGSCPDSELDEHPGELRESIKEIDGSDALQVYVVADAQDAKGNYYGIHVELGHNMPDGKHVPARPYFWPAWRLVKRDAKSRIAQALRAAIAGGGSSGG